MGVKGKKVGATLLKTHSSLEKDVQFHHQKINFKTFLLVGSKLPRLYVCTSLDLGIMCDQYLFTLIQMDG